MTPQKIPNKIFFRILGAKIQTFETFFPSKSVNFRPKTRNDYFSRLFLNLIFRQKIYFWNTVIEQSLWNFVNFYHEMRAVIYKIKWFICRDWESLLVLLEHFQWRIIVAANLYLLPWLKLYLGSVGHPEGRPHHRVQILSLAWGGQPGIKT